MDSEVQALAKPYLSVLRQDIDMAFTQAAYNEDADKLKLPIGMKCGK